MTVVIHLKGKADMRVRQKCNDWYLDYPWNTFEEFKEELEFEEYWYHRMKKFLIKVGLEEPYHKKEYSTIEVSSSDNKSSDDNFNKLAVNKEGIIKTTTERMEEQEENYLDKERIEEEGNFGNEEMDHEETYFDEEDYNPSSYYKPKDTTDEDVQYPFPIIS
eukprot:Gb_21175 [translate_table: standard]